MRVLVSAASRHGGTAQIARRLADVLRGAGIEVAVIAPGEVLDLAGYDAAVLGSAVYFGRWLRPARAFVARFQRELRERPVWLFSSGPVGPTDRPPVTVAARTAQCAPVEHRVFGGRVQRERLRPVERWVAARLGVADRDDRDWDEIEGWAKSIAEELAARR